MNYLKDSKAIGIFTGLSTLLLLLPILVSAQQNNSNHMQHDSTHDNHHKSHSGHNLHDKQQTHHNMVLNHNGMVMHSNANQLPKGCEKIAKDYNFTIYAGSQYATEFPNKVFGYSDYELNVEPCSRLAITFINKDKVRHQWMVHGLPRYLYGQGMFHLEATGSKEIAGVFIVPSDHKTYLIHCDMAQHMEKGMKAQLVVGKGSGNLWAIPGVSTDFNRGNYLPDKIWIAGLVVFIFSGMLEYKLYK